MTDRSKIKKSNEEFQNQSSNSEFQSSNNEFKNKSSNSEFNNKSLKRKLKYNDNMTRFDQN